jgi:DNA repair exonuclease SbcCD nuclease subunit
LRVLLFSDVHLHEFPDFASIDPETGLNTRLLEGVNAIRRIALEVMKRAVNKVVFCGDFFHVRGVVRVPVLQAADSALRDMESATSDLTILVGNHDQTDKAGSHAATTVFRRRNTHVVKRFRTDGELAFFAYYADPNAFREDLKTAYKKGARVAFVHAGIHGAATGPRDYVPREEINPDEFKQWRMVFSGHYHAPQQIGKNIVYVGAPLQHYRSERKYKTGFVIYDTESNTYERVPLRTPRFVEWSSAKDDRRVAGNYVDALLPEGWSTDRLRKHLQSAKAVNILLPKSTKPRLTEQRLSIDTSTDHALMLDRYARRFKGELNLKRLLQVGSVIANTQLQEK